MSDNIKHPAHYISDSGFETIEAIEGLTAGKTGIDAYCVGNIIKYISRYDKKNGLEDLNKAAWYLNYLIRRAELKDLK